MTEHRMAYGARQKGEPGFVAVVADLPGQQRETAKTVAEWIRDGLEVERVTAKAAGDGFVEHMNWRELNEAKMPPQGALL